jgi:hypothetical protein
MFGKDHLKALLAASLCLLILVSPVETVRSAEAEKPVDNVKSVEAAFKQSVVLYRKGDYQASFREFGRLARGGHPGARYYLAIMYATGQGTSQDHERAYVWLSCLADNQTIDEDLRADADRQRGLVRKKIAFDIVQRARLSAERECQASVVLAQEDEEDELLFSPFRGTLFDQLVFFAGDMVVLGMLIMAQLFGATWMHELTMSIYKYYGDWFVGLISLLWWILFARVGYLFWQVLEGLHGRSTPGKLNTSFFVQNPKDDRRI